MLGLPPNLHKTCRLRQYNLLIIIPTSPPLRLWSHNLHKLSSGQETEEKDKTWSYPPLQITVVHTQHRSSLSLSLQSSFIWVSVDVVISLGSCILNIHIAVCGFRLNPSIRSCPEMAYELSEQKSKNCFCFGFSNFGSKKMIWGGHYLKCFAWTLQRLGWVSLALASFSHFWLWCFSSTEACLL